MKKILILLATMAIFLSACTSSASPTKIKAKDMTKLLDNKETLVVYIGSSVCSACQSYKPIVSELIKNYKVKVYYVETNSDATADLTSLQDKYLGTVQYTPTTFIFKDGVLLDSKVGALGYLALKNWFVQYGIITT
jgi:predicted bacteriocin transport accessory protein